MRCHTFYEAGQKQERFLGFPLHCQNPPRSPSLLTTNAAHQSTSSPSPSKVARSTASASAYANASGYHLTTRRLAFHAAFGWLSLAVCCPDPIHGHPLLAAHYDSALPHRASLLPTLFALCPPFPAPRQGCPLSELSFANPAKNKPTEPPPPSPSQKSFINLHI
jgi:hypothetical protein